MDLMKTSLPDVRLPQDAIINGAARPAHHGERFDNTGPRDARVLNRVAACDAVDVDAAVMAARTAFDDDRWRGLAPRRRKAVMLALADLMEARSDELALLETLDTGKPISETRNVDIPLAIGTLRYYAEAIDKVYGEIAPSGTERMTWIVHEPLGVIGAIVPWNFPLHMAMWKVAPAMAAGNSIVLKPAEQSPLTALRLGELALEAGVPDGVLNVVPGTGAAAGSALALHMQVDMIAFTGSDRVGRLLLEYSARSNIKRVGLELGGKSPHIVLADCPDLDAAATAAAWGIFYNQGQVCTAGSRLLVAREIREAFVEKLLAIAAGITPGDPLDPATRLGALISASHLDGVMAHVHKAQEEGARLLAGGDRASVSTGGYYMNPTIFDAVDNGMRLAQREVFGPVLGVIEVNDAEHALRIANDSDYGLAAGLWTANIDTAHRMARRLRSGLVWINGWDACDIAVPFGGFKQSGFGRDRGVQALHKYCDVKAISLSLRP